jgi:FtsP/CotA-like multicopper oxidase with cupredoxin domain
MKISSADGFGHPAMSRRRFVGGTALATGAFAIISRSARAQVTPGIGVDFNSPATTPWVWPLAFARHAVPLPAWKRLDPLPIPAAHQRYDEFAPVKFYDMTVSECLSRPHPQLAASPATAYQGSVPGVTFMGRYGEPVLCRVRNHLPASMQGFGSSDIITHVHNGHHASESDGWPGDWFGPGQFKDHHWPHIYAGGDWREAKGTLWYHDHRMDYTAQNTYRGLSGFFLLFDHLDSGDENDPSLDAFRLPSGVPDGSRWRGCYDIPLVFTDRRYDPNGRLVMDVMDMDGHLGDKYLVNGRVQPYFEVERRKYRFRLLDGGPSRYYLFAMSNGMSFQHIANDGNMLPNPIETDFVDLGVAERADIVVDFSQVPEGVNELYLVNRRLQVSGEKPTDTILPLAESGQLLKFIIRPETGVPDNSQVPSSLRPLPEMDTPVVRTRDFRFDRRNGMWTVNGNVFDHNRTDVTFKRGTAEIWRISTSGGWAHPVHMHMEELRILTYNRKPVDSGVLHCRKDVFNLYPGDEMELYVRFRDWLGRYAMHCHNTVHEDHAMMVRFDVVP